jgi:type I restriction enzyme R subunit
LGERDSLRKRSSEAGSTQVDDGYSRTARQAMLGDFANALDSAVMESGEAHQNQMNQVLGNKNVAANFGRIVSRSRPSHFARSK